MQTATILLILAYAFFILFFVIRGALRTRSMADYAVGSARFPAWAVGLSLAASMTSAATFIINPGFIALYGWSGMVSFGLVLPLGAFISLVILTKEFRRHGEMVKALTLSQWMGKRYGSKGFALYFAILALLLLTFIVLIGVGITKVLAQALGADEWKVLLGVVVFVFGYMMFGGANSMVYTNTIQALIMLVVAVILLGSGLEHFQDGVGGFFGKLSAIDPALSGWTNPQSPLFRDGFEVFFCAFVVGVAIVCQPHIITRSLLLKEEKQVNRYLIVGILVQMLFFWVVFTGFYARLQFPDLTFNGQALKMDGIIPAYVVEEFSVAVGLLVILGLLSAGLSTLEGLIQSLSTTLSSDLIQPLWGREIPEKNKVWLNRAVIAALALGAFFLTHWQLRHPNLSVGIFAQNGVYGYFSAAFVPVLAGIFFKNASRPAVVAASLTAVVVHFGSYYLGISHYLQGAVRNPAVSATFALLASVLVWIVISALRSKYAAR